MDKRIIVFGASVECGPWDKEGGWVERLRKFLCYKVIESNYKLYYLLFNLGISGDTSTEILKRFKSDAKPRIDKNEKNIFIICTGKNDALYHDTTGKLKCSPKRYKGNLEKIIKIAKNYSKTIVLVGTYAVDESLVAPVPWLKECSYLNKYILEYNEIAKRVAKDSHAEFIDVSRDTDNKKWFDMLADGIHPNTRGHEKIFRTVKDYLIKNKII